VLARSVLAKRRKTLYGISVIWYIRPLYNYRWNDKVKVLNCALFLKVCLHRGASQVPFGTKNLAWKTGVPNMAPRMENGLPNMEPRMVNGVPNMVPNMAPRKPFWDQKPRMENCVPNMAPRMENGVAEGAPRMENGVAEGAPRRHTTHVLRV
jgi:hypothetical protein